MEKTSGLTTQEAQARSKQYGLNVLPEKLPTSDFIIFLSQLKSPLIYILIIAALISFVLSEVTDAAVILLAVVINTILGFYQERKAERGLAALKQILTPRAKVIRDGKQVEIEAQYVVPGEVVIVTSGDRIPADGYLIEASSLTVNEAILTGESIPVLKESKQFAVSSFQKTDVEQSAANYRLPTANSLVFMGTTVVGGIGKFVVSGTGLQTEIGKIAESLSETREEPTPLQKRFADLAKVLTWVVVVAAGLIFATGIIRQEPLAEMFTTAVAVAVAAIPEGLVIGLTTILAIGMQRILKRRALVRRLVVAETLGTVTVIATDKTGTLTEGKLKVVKTYFRDKRLALEVATFANQLLDPLEHALWEWLTKQPHFDPEELLSRHTKVHVLPFDAEHKFSAVSFDHAIALLGAPEVLIQKATLSKAAKVKLEKKIESWGRDGLRVLGLGVRKIRQRETERTLVKHADLDQVEFVGMVGFADPIRPSVREALNLCKQAGISVRVVTGDYRWTAESVMRQVGIPITDPESQIVEGEELAHLTASELSKRIGSVRLFARVSPQQKYAIVEALKKNGEVVALLGDGVNDAPALKRADIGIVVGDASDVARETADMVLLDSNFSTIVAAVEEGRGIFANIQKVMTYLLSDTFAEVTLIFLGLIFGVPLPLTAAQILWINLVTDTLPTLALTVEPKEKHLLKRMPINQDLPILSRNVGLFTIIISLTSGVTIFLLYLYILRMTGEVTTARVIAFSAFSLKSLVYVFSLRDRTRLIFKTSVFVNPWLWAAVFMSFGLLLIGLYVPVTQHILQTRVLTFSEWFMIVGAAIFITAVIESIKIVRVVLHRGGILTKFNV